MIKVGLNNNLPDFVALYRLLKTHPDVEIMWVHDFGRVSSITQTYPELVGEADSAMTATPDYKAINLYIGPAEPRLKEAMAANADLKAILTSSYGHSATSVDCPLEIGLPEFNRKALVRGARVTHMPEEFTMLGALALMPLARNLLLTGDITGSVLLGGERMSTWGRYYREWFVEELCERVLRPLQSSFNSRFKVIPFSVTGNVRMATFMIESKINPVDLRQIYHRFYDDHRHVVILDESVQEIRAGMVEGTNKAVISLVGGEGCFSVSVAFDARYRMGHGNILHLLNLLFGLDERTGF